MDEAPHGVASFQSSECVGIQLSSVHKWCNHHLTAVRILTFLRMGLFFGKKKKVI
jgi:hypothetical protein